MNSAAQHVEFDAPRRIAPEDQARADFYALLANLFYRAPDARLLQAIVVAPPPEGEGAATLVRAWNELAAASAVVSHDALVEEYEVLFGGTGRPEVMLFGSFYIAGFMNEKPLAELRTELAELGLARSTSATESEDHLAALCDVMRALILGDLAAAPASLATQKLFFTRQLAPWVQRCCDATTQNSKANYYRKVAAFAGAFFAIEEAAFDLS
jgi:TorA maturation chaperone TorD